MANEQNVEAQDLLLDELICITTALEELKEENRRLEALAASFAREDLESHAGTCSEVEPWVSYLTLEKHEQCIPCEECGSICCIQAKMATTH